MNKTNDETIRSLRNTITDMDCFSQAGFSEIASIAKLALNRLESPETYRRFDDIANLLSVIWKKAEEIENCINSTAEDQGCHYVDEGRERREQAALQAREKLTH